MWSSADVVLQDDGDPIAEVLDLRFTIISTCAAGGIPKWCTPASLGFWPLLDATTHA